MEIKADDLKNSIDRTDINFQEIIDEVTKGKKLTYPVFKQMMAQILDFEPKVGASKDFMTSQFSTIAVQPGKFS